MLAESVRRPQAKPDMIATRSPTHTAFLTLKIGSFICCGLSPESPSITLPCG